MKFLQIFSKTPNYKKFNYTPRFYNADEEERRDRYERIEKEVNAKKEEPANTAPDLGYRARMQGSFRQARKANGYTETAAPSPALLRMGILLVLTVGFIGYLQYGMPAIYGVALVLIPAFLFFRFQKLSKRGR